MFYDLIGDLHGHADELEALLVKMDYKEKGGIWRHAERTAVFLGDFIDRGPRQRDSLRIARGMIDGGHALAVMGNHEFNAIAFHTVDPIAPGQHLRRRTEKNREQHEAFLREVGEDSAEHAEWVDWFLTLPLWLDLGGLRVVHACWHPTAIVRTAELLGGPFLTREMMPEACRYEGDSGNSYGADGSPPDSGSELFHCVETLLKGIEVALPEGISFKDHGGHERRSTRVRWWLGHPTSYRDGSLATGLCYEDMPETVLPEVVVPGHDGAAPVFIGHYWLTGDRSPLAPKVASVDYSVARNGPLVAYRWSGEDVIEALKFVSSSHD
jgi:hypothetical protein